MSRYRRDYTKGATYFLTVVTFNRRPFLCDPDVRSAIRTAISQTRINYPFTIDAMVLLPDHFHCLMTLPDNCDDHSIRLRLVKHRVTRQCGPRLHNPGLLTPSRRKHRESSLWQRRYWEHRIRDDDDFLEHCRYIHQNPVKHGLVGFAEDWPYSTYHRFLAVGYDFGK